MSLDAESFMSAAHRLPNELLHQVFGLVLQHERPEDADEEIPFDLDDDSARQALDDLKSCCMTCKRWYRDLAGSIPAELLLLILEHFLPNHIPHEFPESYNERQTSRQTIKNAALVCKSWSGPVSRLLWSTSSAFVTASNTAEAILASSASAYARQLIVYPKCKQGVNEDRPVSPEQLKRILEHCQALQKITIYLKSKCSCVQTLSIAPSSTLSTLNVWCSERLAFAELAAILKYAPTVDKLSIRSTKSVWVDADILPTKLPSLRTLQLHIGQMPLPMDLLLSRLFTFETLSVIETLELDRIEFLEDVDESEAVEALATSLQSLKVNISQNGPWRPRLFLFDPFAQLRKIEFDRYSAPSLLRSINDIFADCPCSVEEIVYTMYLDEIFDLQLPIDPDVLEGKSLKKLEAWYIVSEARFNVDEYLNAAQPYIDHLASHGVELSLKLA